MASINETMASHGRRAGVRRMKKANLRIDMTPMVDLGFLLIAFFVMTAKLSEPVVTRLNMPKEGKDSPLGESSALTVLLGVGSVYYYQGKWEEAIKQNKVLKTNLSIQNGLGEVIRSKQAELSRPGISKEGKKGLMLLIKATDQTPYKILINALDETQINGVKKYAIVKPDPQELDYVKKTDREDR